MKAQAAIEYLTTYGWAIIVLILMLGALSYFGVINPRSWAPDRCDSGTEITCVDHVFTAASDRVNLTMTITNNLPERITINEITCRFEDVLNTPASLSVSIGSQDDAEISCIIDNAGVAASNGKIKATFNIKYVKKDKPFTHEIDGTAFSNLIR